jgi:hypothetical protein
MSGTSLSRPSGGLLDVVLRASSLGACCLALACAGCGDSKGNRVAGTVTFKGNPVPAGKIYFNPDASKRNSGQAGFADIKNGRYDTAQRGAQGVVGGPTVVHIEGFDGSGVMLFTHDTAAELPKGSATKDFEVPAAAANNAPKGPIVQP